MAGVAGSTIGIAGLQSPIGDIQAVTDATTSGRGSMNNFIGFGLGATSQEPLPEDFSAADDTVTLAINAGPDYAPTYTAIPGNTLDKTLTWVEVI